jgi:ketosteroid isomerase-like protein
MKSRLLFAVASVALLAGASAAPAFASDKTDVMDEIHKAIADFNKGDMAAWVGSCAPQTSIIDEFAPYTWQGASACSDWAKAFEAGNQKNGDSDGVVSIAKVRHIEVTGDNAYVVITANFKYKEKGKQKSESGASWTLGLQKTADGWRIASWAWAMK